MKTRLLLIALITAIAGMGTSLAACSSDDDSNNNGGDAGKDSGPGQNDSGGGDDTTFTQVYDQVISQRCVGCHSTTFPDGGARTPSGGLVLKGKDIAYQNLVNKESPGGPCKPGTPDTGTDWKLVEPNNVAKSLLHSKVSSDSPKCGKRMPLPPPDAGANPLSAAQIQLIEDWIEDGAQP